MLVHALFSGLVGAGLGVACLSARTRVKVIAPAGGLAGGMLFHSVHNLGASLSATNVLTICFISARQQTLFKRPLWYNDDITRPFRCF